ncbi:hypothetical protein LOB72_09215, partial [Lactobacillus delbrueckii subsp. lactis]|uniref:hypothetical protein n=1 Tax=Lactobacillus delbrueckii TaxID=1584 RepID=UPI001E3785A4
LAAAFLAAAFLAAAFLAVAFLAAAFLAAAFLAVAFLAAALSVTLFVFADAVLITGITAFVMITDTPATAINTLPLLNNLFPNILFFIRFSF